MGICSAWHGSGIGQFVAITLVPWQFMVNTPYSHVITSKGPFFVPLVQLTISSGLGALKVVIKVPLGLN
jgi:hypothetical protein